MICILYVDLILDRDLEINMTEICGCGHGLEHGQNHKWVTLLSNPTFYHFLFAYLCDWWESYEIYIMFISVVLGVSWEIFCMSRSLMISYRIWILKFYSDYPLPKK